MDQTIANYTYIIKKLKQVYEYVFLDKMFTEDEKTETFQHVQMLEESLVAIM